MRVSLLRGVCQRCRCECLLSDAARGEGQAEGSRGLSARADTLTLMLKESMLMLVTLKAIMMVLRRCISARLQQPSGASGRERLSLAL